MDILVITRVHEPAFARVVILPYAIILLLQHPPLTQTRFEWAREIFRHVHDQPGFVREVLLEERVPGGDGQAVVAAFYDEVGGGDKGFHAC